MNKRRESYNTEDRREQVGTQAEVKRAAPQDNTFVHEGDFAPIRDIVKRNKVHEAKMAVKKKRPNADMQHYQPAEPIYEPIRDTKEALERIGKAQYPRAAKKRTMGKPNKAPF